MLLLRAAFCHYDGTKYCVAVEALETFKEKRNIFGMLKMLKNKNGLLHRQFK